MNIQNLLPKDAHTKRRSEVVGLTRKWERTGLLENLAELEKGTVAQLLENQAKQLVTEANRTGTVQGSEEWAGIALPLIRRIFGEITAKEFVSVQPMNLPSGLVFWLEFKYGTGQAGFTTGSGKDSQEDSIWGVTDASKGTVATGGLYGAGRFAYSINDFSANLFVSRSVSTLSAASGSVTAASTQTLFNEYTQFDTETSSSLAALGANLFKITISTASLTNPDVEGARAYTLSATGLHSVFNQFTTVNSAKTQISFIVSASSAFGNAGVGPALTVYYQKQPTDITRGDFEDSLSNPSTALDIPELNLEFHSQALTAKTRKLKATPEFAQDINAYQNIDAEAELTGILGEYVAREIDLEIIDMLRLNAQTTKYWSSRIGYEWNGNNAFVQSAANYTAYNQGTWFQTLGTKIQGLSNEIDRLTFRGGANFIVTSPKVATILESIPGYAADTDGSKNQFAMGSRKVGMLNSRFTVYKSPYMKENVLLMGYRGSQYLETGAVYAPYIPLIMTPLVHDPDNFTPRKAVMTRYAKEMLRPEFYGKIFIEGLETV